MKDAQARARGSFSRRAEARRARPVAVDPRGRAAVGRRPPRRVLGLRRGEVGHGVLGDPRHGSPPSARRRTAPTSRGSSPAGWTRRRSTPGSPPSRPATPRRAAVGGAADAARLSPGVHGVAGDGSGSTIRALRRARRTCRSTGSPRRRPRRPTMHGPPPRSPAARRRVPRRTSTSARPCSWPPCLFLVGISGQLPDPPGAHGLDRRGRAAAGVRGDAAARPARTAELNRARVPTHGGVVVRARLRPATPSL